MHVFGATTGTALKSTMATTADQSRQRRLVQFFKSRMCPWFEHGRCSRGETCNYAHCVEELRPTPDLSRTKLCPNLSKCKQANCTFAHSEEELRVTPAYYKICLCKKFQKKGWCRYGDNCRYAHGEAELRSCVVGSNGETLSLPVHNPGCPPVIIGNCFPAPCEVFLLPSDNYNSYNTRLQPEETYTKQMGSSGWVPSAPGAPVECRTLSYCHSVESSMGVKRGCGSESSREQPVHSLSASADLACPRSSLSHPITSDVLNASRAETVDRYGCSGLIQPYETASRSSVRGRTFRWGDDCSLLDSPSFAEHTSPALSSRSEERPDSTLQCRKLSSNTNVDRSLEGGSTLADNNSAGSNTRMMLDERSRYGRYLCPYLGAAYSYQQSFGYWGEPSLVSSACRTSGQCRGEPCYCSLASFQLRRMFEGVSLQELQEATPLQYLD